LETSFEKIKKITEKLIANKIKEKGKNEEEKIVEEYKDIYLFESDEKVEVD
jgi:hypothetical protein